MAAQIGPDWVLGIAGFGDTVADALRDLGYWFAKHHYELRGNSVGIEVAGGLIEVKGTPGQAPSESYTLRSALFPSAADVASRLPGLLPARKTVMSVRW